MIEKQLSIFLENKPGVLAAVCKVLADQQINIRGISISDTVDHAVVRLVVSDPQTALHILGDHGALVVETDVLAVKLSDRPGALAELADRFAQADVNVEYAYGSSNTNEGTVFFRVSDVKKAKQVLSATKKEEKKKKKGK